MRYPESTEPAAHPIPSHTWRGRVISIWQTEFPLNFRTLLFCFLAGSIGSIPIGLLVVTRWEVFAAPLWTAPIYLVVVTFALFGLPIWSYFGLRDQPLLRWAGVALTPCMITFAVALSTLLGPR